jgi:hypothetical protein
MCMTVNEIIHALNLERQRLDGAIAALSGAVPDGRRRSRPAGLGAVVARKPRRMSAAGRKKISDAAKARWAKAKRAGKNSL